MSDHEHRERRLFTRVTARHEAHLLDDSGNVVYQGRIADISLGGVLIDGGESGVSKNALVHVMIILDPENESTVEARGHVVRVSQSGVAIAFDEVEDPESLEHLRNIVLYNAEATEQVETELRNRPGILRDSRDT